MAVFSTIWAFIKSFFTASGAGGLLLKLLAKYAAKEVIQMLKDDDIAKKAIAYVKELNGRTDIDNIQKAKEFNKRLGAYLLKIGKKAGEATLNLLRELAVNAVKGALSRGEEI